MKNQAIQYLALDVHQATVVATARDEQGAIRMRATVPTEANAILGLVRGLGPRVHVAFEEGTQAQWLHDLLQPHAERVVVCNMRGRSETSNKSDRIDADGVDPTNPAIAYAATTAGVFKTTDRGRPVDARRRVSRCTRGTS